MINIQIAKAEYTIEQQFAVEHSKAWTNISTARDDWNDVQRYINGKLQLTFVCGAYVKLHERTHIVTVRQARPVVIPFDDLRTHETEFLNIEEAELYLDIIRGEHY